MNMINDSLSLMDDFLIDYGPYGSKNVKYNGLDSHNKLVFYITTAINYTNGPAHMGHAYEAITSDAIARYQRVKSGNKTVYFLTGSDEHGQKVANLALEEGRKPIDICNKYVMGFKCLNQRTLISNNKYVRTTTDIHIRTAQKLWNLCSENINAQTNQSDIYLSMYNGWYNVREETFVTDNDAQLDNYIDKISGQPLKKVQEESYFFRMSAYQSQLINYIMSHPMFIRPIHHRNYILRRLKAEPLRDLSISRTNFDWGIRLPEGFNKNHVMYVWFDALANYFTGVDALDINTQNKTTVNLCSFWPADIHIIGKDILWFHTVIWPCILFSANMPLPKSIFAHGFVNDMYGKKMSKSLSNVVNPHDILERYPVDSFRWYLYREAPYGADLSFSESSLMDMYNADLCDNLGNLVHRITNLCRVYCDGIVPDVESPVILDWAKIRMLFMQYMDNLELQAGATLVSGTCRDINGYLTDRAPWHMKGKEHAQKRIIVVRATLEALYAVTHMFIPFIPVGSRKVFHKLGTSPMSLTALSVNLRNLKNGTPILVGDVLYKKIVSDKRKDDISLNMNKKSESYSKATANTIGQKINERIDSENQSEFTKIDIRVGKIIKVWNHPEAEKLFCEQIDLGDDLGLREIASSLRNHYTIGQLEGMLVLVVINVKVAKMVGFSSYGILLTAQSTEESKMELINPPVGSVIGERIFIDGLIGEAYSPAQVKKKKTFQIVSRDLITDKEGVATWKGLPIKSSSGVCSAASLVNAYII